MKTKVKIIDSWKRTTSLLKNSIWYIDWYWWDKHCIAVVTWKHIGLLRWHDVEVISNLEYYYNIIKRIYERLDIRK